ncbi:hypothetical protein [Streptomyces sp. GESEQ-4]|uniref:hypothetical protein n=1 Tax=Streptomyces sp. GESEQ-4 TaxID=2812655 RepID=UPI001B335E07|nr:hypothetical protein [Streptomyces sp. GESEQ-4]
MRKHFKTMAVSCGVIVAVMSPAALAIADEEPIAVSEEGVPVDPADLSADQLSALTDEPVAEGFDMTAEEAAAAGIDTEETGIPDASDGTDDVAAPSYATRYKNASYKRGSALMWTRDTVYFGHNGSKITSSKGWQSKGYIFPNVAKNSGISRYYASTGTHKFRAKNTIGAGVATPWGAVTVYEHDFTHWFSGSKSGAWSWRR